MNKSYIIIGVLVILVAGLIFFTKNNKSETAMPMDNSQENMNHESTGVVAEPNVVQDEKGEVKEFIVEGKNFSYSVSEIKVKKGDRVRIIFKNTQGFHDLVIDEFGVATKQGQAPFEEVLEFTADKVGTFQFYCSVGSHRAMGMWGTFKVEE